MAAICSKNLSIVIGMWKEYTGPLRHAGPYFGIADGEPNLICAPHVIELAGNSVSVEADCSLPVVYPVNYTSLCNGCGLTDTGTFEYAAYADFTATVPGTCLVVWDVDFTGTLAMGDVRTTACAVSPGIFGEIVGCLDTYLNSVLVDAIAQWCHVGNHIVTTQNVSRHINAGDTIRYIFQVFAVAGNGNHQASSAAFSFTPDP